MVVHDKDVQSSTQPTSGKPTPWRFTSTELVRSEHVPVPSGDWRDALDAATMPVLQYAGVPGQVSAYGDRWSGNPSLVYATNQTNRHDDEISARRRCHDLRVVHQSLRPLPDRPTRSIRQSGLDVAVVDKDRKVRWVVEATHLHDLGTPPFIFKGCDAHSLGELILGRSIGAHSVAAHATVVISPTFPGVQAAKFSLLLAAFVYNGAEDFGMRCSAPSSTSVGCIERGEGHPC